jgi:predicted glycosyltransferase
MSRPGLLFYCQHALGLGHLVRSLALAGALAEQFEVVLLNGGQMPPDTLIPAGVQVINLPPLGYDGGFGLVSHDPDLSVARAKEIRRQCLLDTLDRVQPRIVLIELYPFGRNKFSFELEPLVEAVVAGGADRPRLVCSLRDILVTRPRGQLRHDDKVVERANGRFDAILVHADPSFVCIEESFQPGIPLTVPVRYTGFVVPPETAPTGDRTPLARVLVSAGGGMVGEPLFRAAVAAHGEVARRLHLTTTVVAGPFLPDAAWAWLQGEAAASPDLDVVRRVDDLRAEMQRSAMSVSQGGYNTTMDILRAGVPAVVVPFADGTEDEQTRRSDRLAARGVLRTIDADRLDADRLVTELRALATFRPRPAVLDLSGRETSARLVAEIAGVSR